MFENTVISEGGNAVKFFSIVSNFVKTDFEPLLDVKIVFSFVSPSRFAGQVPVAVKAYKLAPTVRDLFNFDFHVELSKDAWAAANHAQKLVLIWRGLRLLGVDLDENNKPKIDAAGRVMIFISKPDVDASFFSDEVLKFGPDASLKAISKVLNHLMTRGPKSNTPVA